VSEVEGPLAPKVALQNDGDSEAEAQRHTLLISDLRKSDQIHSLLFSPIETILNPLKNKIQVVR
jgi:hypothetical protein